MTGHWLSTMGKRMVELETWERPNENWCLCRVYVVILFQSRQTCLERGVAMSSKRNSDGSRTWDKSLSPPPPHDCSWGLPIFCGVQTNGTISWRMSEAPKRYSNTQASDLRVATRLWGIEDTAHSCVQRDVLGLFVLQSHEGHGSLLGCWQQYSPPPSRWAAWLPQACHKMLRCVERYSRSGPGCWCRSCSTGTPEEAHGHGAKQGEAPRHATVSQIAFGDKPHLQEEWFCSAPWS